MLISVVIPVYNNRETLEELVLQIHAEHSAHFSLYDLEILFVNDGSKDGSLDELFRLKALYPAQIKVLNLSRNFGQLGALYAGFNRATGEAVISISADLQDPVSLMASMVAHWESGIEVVICHRQQRRDGVLSRLFSRGAYSVARLSYPDLPAGGFDYWLMSRRVCRALCSFKGRHNFLQGYLLSIGYAKTFIPYTRVERKFGKSGYTLFKKIKILIDFIVDSSYMPIRAISLMGALVALGGVGYSILIIVAWMRHQTPFEGWAPLMIALLIVSGIIMIMLGIIGEYIWRIYDNIKDFPLYIVDELEETPRDRQL